MRMFTYAFDHELRNAGALGGYLKRGLLTGYDYDPIFFTHREHMDALVANLVAVFAIRFAEVPTEEDETILNGI